MKQQLNNERIFNYDTSVMQTMLSTAKLNFLERGKILFEYKHKYNLTDYEMADLFKRDRSNISDYIRWYKKSLNLNIDYNKFKEQDIPDKLIQKAIDTDNQDKLDTYFIMYQKYSVLGFDIVVSLINKTLSIEAYKQRKEYEYKKILDALEGLKNEMSSKEL